MQFQRPAWDGYLRVNALLADKLLPLLQDDDIIWIHDYHLLPFAHELRKRGVNNRIGFFGNDSNLLIVFYVQIMPDDLVMQLHRF